VAAQVRTQIRNLAIEHQEAARLVAVGGGIDQARVDENGAAGVLRPVGGFPRCGGVHRLGRFRASASSTAMRTATPISTWSRMTLRERSATVEAISTPRFMGPGCITTASGFARASFSWSRPKKWKYSRVEGT